MESKRGKGRPKGSPNKGSLNVKEIAERLGIDPFECLLKFCAGDWKALGYKKEKYIHNVNEYGSYEKYTIDPAVRAKCVQEACKYLHPQRKAIEHSTDQENGFKVIVMDYLSKDKDDPST